MDTWLSFFCFVTTKFQKFLENSCANNFCVTENDFAFFFSFHLDHAGALPYFLEKTSFKGRVFMTHPTKAIYKMLLTDYVKVSNIAVEGISAKNKKN